MLLTYQWKKNERRNWIFREEDGLRIAYGNKPGAWFGMKSPYGFFRE